MTLTATRMLQRLVLTAGLAAAALSPWQAATAADAVRGNTLYHATPTGGGTPCSVCHGTNPANNVSKIQNGANAPAVIQSAINNNTGGMGALAGKWTATDIADIAAYIGNPTATGAPLASVSPASLAFASTIVGSTSAAATVTVSNTGTAGLSISGVAVSGAQAGDFVATGSGSCVAGGTVAAGASCSISVSFRPTGTSTRTASLVVTHNATGGSSSVSLTGAGAAAPQPTISASASTVSFGDVTVGSQSAVSTLTLTNSGNAPLSFTSLAIAGANAAQFSRTGSCAVGTAVAAGASCTVGLTFAPVATGVVGATFSVTSNSPTNPTIPLSGNGIPVALPVAALSPASIAFGNQRVGVVSAVQSLTLSNTGSASLTLGAVSLTGSGAFAIASNSCPATLAGGQQCQVGVSFTPSAAGAVTGSLQVASNASNGSVSAALGGNGVNQATASPVLGETLPFGFAAVVVGQQSAVHTTSLSNTGTAPFVLATLAMGGLNAADFQLLGGQASDCLVGQTVAAGASCSIRSRFAPSAAGTRAGRFTLSTDGGAQLGLDLTGSGTIVVVAPAASVQPQSLSFAALAVGQPAAPARLHLSNSGGLPLSVTGIQFSGRFSQTADPAGCLLPPFDLAPGAGCDLLVTFDNSVEGASQGSVVITSNAGGAPITVPLAATATKAAPVAAPTAADSAAATPGNTSGGTPSNVGLGGCSMVAGTNDPMLPALVLAAAGLLWWRRRR